MESLTQAVLFLFILVAIFSCKEDNPVPPIPEIEEEHVCIESTHHLLSLLDSVPEQKYASSDILAGIHPEICGVWKFLGGAGGLSGGYFPDFDFLLFKPNSIFGIVRNDSLIVSGKVELAEWSNQNPRIEFITELEPRDIGILLLSEFSKTVYYYPDSLVLASPCCDRFDEHFVRAKK